MDLMEPLEEKSSGTNTDAKIYELFALVSEVLLEMSDDIFLEIANNFKPNAFLNGDKLKPVFEAVGKKLQPAVKTSLETVIRELKKKKNWKESVVLECQKAAARLAGLPVEDFYRNYRALANVDAIADLLAGELHRLDPVIGDLGCQWRVPFILDLHAALQEHCRVKLKTFDVRNLLEIYAKLRSEAPPFPEILKICTASPTIKVKGEGKKAPLIERYVDPKISLVNAHIATCVTNLRKSKFNDLLANLEVFLTNWNKHDDFDALDYLQLCKLMTTNRVRTLDPFGLSGTPIEFTLPNSKQVLQLIHESLSKYSMHYMTKVCETVCRLNGVEANDPITITDKVPMSLSSLYLMKHKRFRTQQQNTKYDTNVCYGPLRSIFIRQALVGQPIVIDLRRLICKKVDGKENEFQYQFNGAAILYFAPDGKGGFVHLPEPEEEDQRRMALVCEVCSVLRLDAPVPEDGDKVLCAPEFETYVKALVSRPITDWLLFGISSHPELPSPIYRPGTKTEVDNLELFSNLVYCEATGRDGLPVPGPWSLMTKSLPFPDACGPEWDLLTEKLTLKGVLAKFGATTSQYKRPVPGNRTLADRTAETMVFAPIHIFGSTYARKRMELAVALKDLDRSAWQPQRVTAKECRPRPE